MQRQEPEKSDRKERRLWAYHRASEWFAVDPAECDFDEDRVNEATIMFKASTKSALTTRAQAAQFEIVMWLD